MECGGLTPLFLRNVTNIQKCRSCQKRMSDIFLSLKLLILFLSLLARITLFLVLSGFGNESDVKPSHSTFAFSHIILYHETVHFILLGLFVNSVWIGTALRRRVLLIAGYFICDNAIERQRYRKDRVGNFAVVGRHVQRKEFLRKRISSSPAALARLAVFMRRHCHGRSGQSKELGSWE